jgi:cytochrome c-type biogenesis protein CcmH/NrfG
MNTLHARRASDCYIHEMTEKQVDFDSTEGPHDFQSHLDLGIAYLDMRRFSDAASELEIACQLDPNHEESARLLHEAKAARDEQAKRG